MHLGNISFVRQQMLTCYLIGNQSYNTCKFHEQAVENVLKLDNGTTTENIQRKDFLYFCSWASTFFSQNGITLRKFFSKIGAKAFSLPDWGKARKKPQKTKIVLWNIWAWKYVPGFSFKTLDRLHILSLTTYNQFGCFVSFSNSTFGHQQNVYERIR